MTQMSLGTIPLTTILCNLAGAMFLLAYVVRQMWLLRVITLIGLAANIAFFWCALGTSEISPIVWNSLYFAVNVYQLACIRHKQNHETNSLSIS